MKRIFLLVALLASLGVGAQKPYTTTTDDETGAQVFKGSITMADLSTEPSFKWFIKNAADYTPDPAALSFLSSTLPQYSLVVFMGTWCDDSQYLVPKLAKLLQAAHFPMERLQMWGVDRQKQNGGPESSSYGIRKVPTIIVMKDGKEQGRIVESVKKSLEADLMDLLRNAH